MGLRGPNPAEKAERNRIILERWLNGETLSQIGDSYGLTRERIRQVVRKSKENLKDTEDPEIIGRIISRMHWKCASKRHQFKQRRDTRQALKELFETSFDREQILQIIGMGNDADLCACSDEQLCHIIYESFTIRRFFKYIRCSACEEIKTVDQFSRSSVLQGHSCYCRTCNTDRHRQMMLDHPEFQRRVYAARLAKPNRAKIYQQRHYYAIQGRFDEMPPLPPKGAKDSEIVPLPPKPPIDNLKAWRESLGHTFNREKAAQKAKKLVKDEAAQRHIYT